MSCREWRDRILEADPAELRRGPANLGAHLAECESCRDLAQTVLREQSALGSLLDRAAQAPAEDADAVVRRVRLSARTGRASLLRRSLAIATTAAAAVLALLIARPDGRPPQAPASLPPAEATNDQIRPVVEAPVGSRVAVLKTSRPDITVVWYF